MGIIMFSIIIPTFNNLEYLKLCLLSIRKNSTYNHEVVLHINDGNDGTLKYALEENLKYTYSKINIGLCSSLNIASKICSKKFFLYAHDDMYFCPNWDRFLIDEINRTENDKFFFSGTLIEPNSPHISYNFGTDISNFDENDLLNKYSKLNFYNFQGSHYAPHVVSKNVWNKIGGFSEEFNPGMSSDPDFNMKLWNIGVRIFKGINNFKVYHFGSITTRKKKNFIRNKGEITFLKKYGFSTKFFKKHYLKTNTVYKGPLENPKKNFFYWYDLIICKIKFLFIMIR